MPRTRHDEGDPDDRPRRRSKSDELAAEVLPVVRTAKWVGIGCAGILAAAIVVFLALFSAGFLLGLRGDGRGGGHLPPDEPAPVRGADDRPFAVPDGR
jgi:hypothetical protein